MQPLVAHDARLADNESPVTSPSSSARADDPSAASSERLAALGGERVRVVAGGRLVGDEATVGAREDQGFDAEQPGEGFPAAPCHPSFAECADGGRDAHRGPTQCVGVGLVRRHGEVAAQQKIVASAVVFDRESEGSRGPGVPRRGSRRKAGLGSLGALCGQTRGRLRRLAR